MRPDLYVAVMYTALIAFALGTGFALEEWRQTRTRTSLCAVVVSALMMVVVGAVLV
jgi:dolichyl-phosphate-mannose--protein O-mannosyl transferase